MKRLIVKVCGMRDGENIRRVEALAPDWMGFICWEGSRRHVSGVPDYLPVKCRRVGVFVNPSVEYVDTRIKELEPVEIIKAFGIATGKPFPDTAAYEDACDFFLFDTQTPTVGGSGQAFDWNMLSGYQGNTPFLLSGGIGPDSLPPLKDFSHPYWAGVDLNSRFETSPARKDADKLSAFLKALREQNNA